nr:isochorismatase family protein [Desulfobulbaceae bacterium]
MVVDIQDRLMRVINEKERVTKNSVLLIKTAKTLDIPIIPTTQYAEKIGPLLPEITEELGSLPITDKMEFSCFNSQEVKKVVNTLANGVDTLIVCGVETHICIYQTVLGALINDFHVWVPADAVSSRTKENYETGLSRIREIGGIIANTELIIYELLQKAGTPEFKKLLPFLK